MSENISFDFGEFIHCSIVFVVLLTSDCVENHLALDISVCFVVVGTYVYCSQERRRACC